MATADPVLDPELETVRVLGIDETRRGKAKWEICPETGVARGWTAGGQVPSGQKEANEMVDTARRRVTWPSVDVVASGAMSSRGPPPTAAGSGTAHRRAAVDAVREVDFRRPARGHRGRMDREGVDPGCVVLH